MTSACCRFCRRLFEVDDRQRDFLNRIAPVVNGQTFDLPNPELCPECRWQQRLSFRNERVLYRRTCDLTRKSIVSIYPAETPFPVYHVLNWISDEWDPTDYARDYDFSRPFFEQYKEFADTVPHFNLSINPSRDLNSEFTNCATDSKNCYLISQAEANEDCYYSRGINQCKDCSDCLRVDRCELCYEGINLSLCYNCFFCQDCDSCSQCCFSTGLRACKNCFGCHNLIQKEYYYFNEPLTRSDWEARFSAFQFNHEAIEHARRKTEQVRLETPHRYARIILCEDSTGDHLTNCRDALDCYDSRGLEHCTFVSEVQNGAKFCQDYSICGVETELIYECVGCGYSSYNLCFCSACWSNVSNLLYCECCGPSVKDSFGCYGLRHKEYCVLNKPYPRADYERLVSKIIRQMQDSGEWGRFFPPWVSADAYNDTIANDYFPLEKHEALNRGWNWREPIETPASANGSQKLQTDSAETTRACRRTGRPFKIIRQELDLLKRLGLPLPVIHPEVRYQDRVLRRNPRRLWRRRCDCCRIEIQSTYPPDRATPAIYCESCYLAAIG